MPRLRLLEKAVKVKVFRVVLDTNILVSSLLTSGPPAAIIDLIADGKITPFYSSPILREYKTVLSRKGNIRHFPKESFIVTPAQFIKEEINQILLILQQKH